MENHSKIKWHIQIIYCLNGPDGVYKEEILSKYVVVTIYRWFICKIYLLTLSAKVK